MVLIAGTHGFVVSEHLINDAPVFSHAYVFVGGDDLTPVLDRLGFPEHASIVRTIESDGRYDCIRGLLHNTNLDHASTVILPGTDTILGLAAWAN